jgi:hypothetical protein
MVPQFLSTLTTLSYAALKQKSVKFHVLMNSMHMLTTEIAITHNIDSCPRKDFNQADTYDYSEYRY